MVFAYQGQFVGSDVKVLIAGGAGFIGSTVSSACLDEGMTPVILDNLYTGRREFTRGRAFFEGDICDDVPVDKVFAEHPDIDAVVLCAALISVPESVRTRSTTTKRTSSSHFDSSPGSSNVAARAWSSAHRRRSTARATLRWSTRTPRCAPRAPTRGPRRRARRCSATSRGPATSESSRCATSTPSARTLASNGPPDRPAHSRPGPAIGCMEYGSGL